MNQRFDGLERQIVEMKGDMARRFAEVEAELRGEVANVRAEMRTGFGALKASIEARDFRLDEHGRRITELEMLQSRPPEAT